MILQIIVLGLSLCYILYIAALYYYGGLLQEVSLRQCVHIGHEIIELGFFLMSSLVRHRFPNKRLITIFYVLVRSASFVYASISLYYKYGLPEDNLKGLWNKIKNKYIEYKALPYIYLDAVLTVLDDTMRIGFLLALANKVHVLDYIENGAAIIAIFLYAKIAGLNPGLPCLLRLSYALSYQSAGTLDFAKHEFLTIILYIFLSITRKVVSTLVKQYTKQDLLNHPRHHLIMITRSSRLLIIMSHIVGLIYTHGFGLVGKGFIFILHKNTLFLLFAIFTFIGLMQVHDVLCNLGITLGKTNILYLNIEEAVPSTILYSIRRVPNIASKLNKPIQLIRDICKYQWSDPIIIAVHLLTQLYIHFLEYQSTYDDNEVIKHRQFSDCIAKLNVDSTTNDTIN